MVPVDLRRGRVVMAVHRPDEELLGRQIASLQAQTLTAWTCLIGIDGSDEATTGLVNRLVADDERFAVAAFDVNVGVYRHFERLLVLTPSDVAWVALCDQDDVWYSDKLAVLVEDLAGEDVAAAVGQARLTDPSGRVLGHTERHPGGVLDNLLRNQVTGSMTVLRSDVVRVALPFPAATRTAVHDHWLGTCAAAVGVVHARNEILQDYVQHRGNVLGEVERPSLRSKLGRRAEGGLRHRLDSMALERWGWRVSMAIALEGRDLASSDLAGVQAVATGRVTFALLGAVASGVLAKRLDVGRAAGILLCAVWWKGASRRRDHVG